MRAVHLTFVCLDNWTRTKLTSSMEQTLVSVRHTHIAAQEVGNITSFTDGFGRPDSLDNCLQILIHLPSKAAPPHWDALCPKEHVVV